MKLPASTWILILLALGLGGFVYYQEVYRSNQLAIDRSANNKLFDLKKEDIEKIAIVLPKQTIELEKTARDIDPWQLKKPNDVVANTGIVVFLVDLLVNTKRDRKIDVAPIQLVEYGLDKPTAKLEIRGQNDQKYELNLGRISFDEQFIYGLIPNRNNSSDKVQVLLLPKNFRDAVMRDPREWKNKDLTEEDRKIKTTDGDRVNSIEKKPSIKPRTGD
jgi:hypothetical protein